MSIAIANKWNMFVPHVLPLGTECTQLTIELPAASYANPVHVPFALKKVPGGGEVRVTWQKEGGALNSAASSDADANIQMSVVTETEPVRYTVRITDNVSTFEIDRGSTLSGNLNYNIKLSVDWLGTRVRTFGLGGDGADATVTGVNMRTSTGASYVTELADSAFASVTYVEGGFLDDLGFLPSTLTAIPDYAFNYSALKTVDRMPSGIRTVGYQAFASTRVTSARIVPGVEYGTGAFSNCTNLAQAVLQAPVPANAFYNCKALNTLTFEEGATAIRSRAFMGCTGFTTMNLPETVTRVESYAFSGTSTVTGTAMSLIEADLPGVTYLGSYAFRNCRKLTTIRLGAMGVGDGFTINSNAFAVYTKDQLSVYFADGTSKADLQTAAGDNSWWGAPTGSKFYYSETGYIER